VRRAPPAGSHAQPSSSALHSFTLSHGRSAEGGS
jgi:hypothetical protein